MNTTGKAIAVLIIVLLIGAGVAAAGSQGGATIGGIPVFALGVALAFLIQFVAFVPAWIKRTEHYYDLTGSLTYLSVTTLSLLLSRPDGARPVLLWALVVIWAARLGTFLFRRVRKAGKDDRFDELKKSFVRFLNVWVIQGLWVSLTLAATLAAITAGDAAAAELDGFAVAGLLVWLLGFTIEVVSDLQKSRFRAEEANRGRFIHTGLWAWSRHPNYFGEITLWVGMAIIAFPTLVGWQYVTLISPVFVFLLITRVSGVPLLEKKADATWGGQPEYEAYKARTSILVPLPPKRRA